MGACLRPNAPPKAAPTTLAMAATAERRPVVTEREEKVTTEEKATKEEKEAKEVDVTLACLRPIAPPKAAPTTLAMAATAERKPAVTEMEEKVTTEEKATKEEKE